MRHLLMGVKDPAPPELLVVGGAVSRFETAVGVIVLQRALVRDGYTCQVMNPFDEGPMNVGIPEETPWAFTSDVYIMDMGRYLGFGNWRNGSVPSDLTPTRVLFITSAAESALAISQPLPEEETKRAKIKHLLGIEYPDSEIVLVAPSNFDPPESVRALRYTDWEIVRALERGEAIPQELLDQREAWRVLSDTDQVPDLRYQVW